MLRLVALGATLAMLVAAAIMAWMRYSTAQYIFGPTETVPQRPWAIVLGATEWSGEPSPALRARLERARGLYAAGVVERVLVSGRKEGDYDEPQAMQRWLERHGVPPQVITQDPGGVRTRATMQRAVSELGIRAAVICSHAYHLPRAIFLARHAGIDAVGAAADARQRLKWRAREVFSSLRAFFER